MRSKIKVGISMALSLAMVLAFSTFAYAGDETVSASQDNITVTKSAQWVKVNDKSVDENGNPYAPIMMFGIGNGFLLKEIIETFFMIIGSEYQ